MGALEQRLGEESAAPSALLLPIPADGGDGGEGDPLANLKTDIAKAKGRPVVLKTTAGGFGEGPGNAPQRDWQQSRIGANPPEVLVNLRKETTLSVMSACQVPISLVTDADGTSQREAWRRFVMGSIEPLSQRMAEELTRKLDLPETRLQVPIPLGIGSDRKDPSIPAASAGRDGDSGSGIRCRDHGRMRDRRDLGAALLKPAREKILEALRKERQARKKERKLRRQAEGEVKALQRKIDSLEAEKEGPQ